MEGPQNQTEPSTGYRFPKELRLSGHSASDRLFSLGQSFGHYPFRFVFRVSLPPSIPQPPFSPPVEGERGFLGKPDPIPGLQAGAILSVSEGEGVCLPPQVSFLISVPKRQVRLATGRNRLKRQMREAIRLNFRQKLLPLLPLGLHLQVAILFTGGKNKFSFEELEKKLISGFRRLADKAASPQPKTS